MTMKTLLVRAAAIGVCAAVTTLAARPAAAATFSVNPTQIYLSRQIPSTMLTLRNDSSEPVRFQMSAFAWDQSPAGDIQLGETSDVIFFPALVTLNPKEERKIRVGTVAGVAATEKTYRIFVEELPPPSTGPAEAGVRVLTKMGVPIFVRPAKELATATLQSLGAAAGVLHFDVANTGSVHFVPQRLKVRGVAAGGRAAFEQEVSAWYVLAGGSRRFEVPLPAAECGQVESLVVEFGFGSTSLTETLQTPGGVCAPQ